LPLVRAILVGNNVIPLNSKDTEKAAKRVIEVMGQHGQPATDVFNKVVGICNGLGEVTADRLKRQLIFTEMLAAL
ncbi:AIPR family protein, partial [Massilia sp. DJPM01]|nr:AIPR family protein [Massilia sp. DJPM01]